ncbi:MAG: glycosyltransferase family 4 protein [Elusimicrobiota bacterium]
MKVLFISSSIGNGGREIAVVRLASLMNAGGHDVFVVIKKGTWLEREIASLHLPYAAFSIRKYFDPISLIKIGLKLRSFKPHMVQLHFISDIWHVSPAVKMFFNKTKIILFRHMQSSNMKDWARAKLFSAVYKVCAVSEFIKKDFLSKTNVSPDKVDVVYLGVDVEDYAKYDNIRKLRSEYKIDDNTVLVGLVGRIDRAKGQDKLVLAAEEILKFKNNVKFAIIGKSEMIKESGVEKPYDHIIKNLINEHGLEDYFIFTGFRRDVQEILSSLDVAVCASQEEAYGLVVVEAMAAARPIVVFDRGALPELVINNETGKIVPYSVKGLARGIMDIISDPVLEQKYGHNAREHVKIRFNINTTIKQIEGYINEERF